MTRPLSNDLRERAVAAVVGGESCPGAAARFGMAVSSVVKWSQRYRATGSVAPGKMGGHRKRVLEPHGSDREGQFDAFTFHFAQHLADTPQLGGAQEPFALLLGIFLDVLARVRSIRTQPPHLGEVEHLGDDLQGAVGVVGDVPEVVMDFGHVGPRHFRHAMAPECRNDHALQHASVTLGHARFQPDGDVFFVEAVGELPDRDGAAAGIARGGGILTIPGRGDDADRPCTRSQVSTELGPRLMRRDRRPARYCTTYLLRPLGSTRSPKPGSSSSQMKCSLSLYCAASTTRLVSFVMSAIP